MEASFSNFFAWRYGWLIWEHVPDMVQIPSRIVSSEIHYTFVTCRMSPASFRREHLRCEEW